MRHGHKDLSVVALYSWFTGIFGPDSFEQLGGGSHKKRMILFSEQFSKTIAVNRDGHLEDTRPSKKQKLATDTEKQG